MEWLMVSVISSNVFVTKTISDLVWCMVPIIATHDQIPLICGFLCLYCWYVVCGMVGPLFQKVLESFMKYALTTYTNYLTNFDMIKVNIIIFSNCVLSNLIVTLYVML